MKIERKTNGIEAVSEWLETVGVNWECSSVVSEDCFWVWSEGRTKDVSGSGSRTHGCGGCSVTLIILKWMQLSIKERHCLMKLRIASLSSWESVSFLTW